jgi:hypothetical protein
VEGAIAPIRRSNNAKYPESGSSTNEARRLFERSHPWM